MQMKTCPLTLRLLTQGVRNQGARNQGTWGNMAQGVRGKVSL